MDKLSGKKIFNIIFLLIFIGIVLSFSLFFYMSVVMGGGEQDGEFFSLEGDISDSDLLEYDRRFMKNGAFHTAIIEAEYKWFGNIKSDTIVKGKHDFLFEFGENKYGYDYVSDYFGQRTLTEEELSEFCAAIELRRQVYADQGRYYVLAVIPNSQSVYGEYLPSYFDGEGNNTMLRQISEYAEANNVEGFADLTGVISESKYAGMLYNNTENSVNALGAYFVYRGIMNELPSDIVSEERILTQDEFSYYTHYTDGKNTAIDAGLAALIKNETISMSNSTEFKYSVVNHAQGLERTYVKSAYKNELSAKPSVLIDCSNEWDKIQLMPYFSNTFGVATYRIGQGYDAQVIAATNPLVVVQTIHEYELPVLLNAALNKTYEDALGQGSMPYKTSMPIMVEYAILDSNSVCISGIVENDAEVRVFGEGLEPISAKSIDGRFFVRVTFAGGVQDKEVFLDAVSADKSASDHLSFVISGINHVGSAREVAIGSNSMLYQSDYGIDLKLPTDEELEEYQTKLFNYSLYVKELSENYNTKTVYAVMPKKLSVYSDQLPDILKSQYERLLERKSVFFNTLEKANIGYLDLSDSLSEKAGSDKMFYQTDETVTDMAYYYMYCEIINYLAKSTPKYSGALKPVKADRFFEYSVPVTNGGHVSCLGFDPRKVTESVTRLKFTNSKHYLSSGDGTFAYFGNDASQPRAVIVYDGDYSSLIGLLAEHFEYTCVVKDNDGVVQESIISAVRKRAKSTKNGTIPITEVFF